MGVSTPEEWRWTLRAQAVLTPAVAAIAAIAALPREWWAVGAALAASRLAVLTAAQCLVRQRADGRDGWVSLARHALTGGVALAVVAGWAPAVVTTLVVGEVIGDVVYVACVARMLSRR
jgi:hypothetical protein